MKKTQNFSSFNETWKYLSHVEISTTIEKCTLSHYKSFLRQLLALTIILTIT